MNVDERNRLISKWIERQKRGLAWDRDMVLRQQSLYPETEVELDDIAQHDSELYWELLLQALHSDQSDDVLQSLSLRVQGLLETCPAVFVERAETQALSDSQFKELLGWILPYEPDKPEWERLRRVAGDLPGD